MNYDEMKTGENNKINANYEYHRSENKNLPVITIDAYSKLFMNITFAVAAFGFIAGIVFGFAIPMGVIHARFNWPLMLGVWIVFAMAALGFWAIYCHLNNQEETLIELKRISTKLENKDE